MSQKIFGNPNLSEPNLILGRKETVYKQDPGRFCHVDLKQYFDNIIIESHLHFGKIKITILLPILLSVLVLLTLHW